MKGLKTRSLVGCKNVSNFLLTSGFCKTKFFDTSLENDYKNSTSTVRLWKSLVCFWHHTNMLQPYRRFFFFFQNYSFSLVIRKPKNINLQQLFKFEKL